MTSKMTERYYTILYNEQILFSHGGEDMAKAQVRSTETTKTIKKGVRDTIEGVRAVQFVNAKSTAVIRLASNALSLSNVDSLIGTSYADAFVITDFVGDLTIDAQNGKNTFILHFKRDYAKKTL